MPASMWAMMEQEELKNFGAGTLRYPPQVMWRGEGANQSHLQKARVMGGSDRRQVTCLCSPGRLGLDMTGMAQRAPGSFGAIIQLTQNPSLPIGKAGVGGEEVDRELREDWKKGAGSWPQG